MWHRASVPIAGTQCRQTQSLLPLYPNNTRNLTPPSPLTNGSSEPPPILIISPITTLHYLATRGIQQPCPLCLQSYIQASCKLATMATLYVPPASLEHTHPHLHSPQVKTKPESPTFFTSRAGYYGSINSLKTAIHHSQQVPKNLHLLPLLVLAKDALPRAAPSSTSSDDSHPTLGCVEDLSPPATDLKIDTLLLCLQELRNVVHASRLDTVFPSRADMIDPSLTLRNRYATTPFLTENLTPQQAPHPA